jgi:Papain-like cysteine protease AvrRpt2
LASKHSAAELEAFSKKIAGKDQKWLNDNLHLVGQSNGKGIKQQWHDSCGPTTVQAMMGELDPIYALKLHEQNTDITSVDDSDGERRNPLMAEQQKTWLEGHGGTAVSRDGTGGQGMPLDGLLNEQTSKIGLKFQIESTSGDGKMDDALSKAEKALKRGMPVPVRVGSGSGGHFVLMTGVDSGPPRRYSFHDPWEGKTLVFTDDQIKKNQINIAGWTQMTHIYEPSVADGP